MALSTQNFKMPRLGPHSIGPHSPTDDRAAQTNMRNGAVDLRAIRADSLVDIWHQLRAD